MTASFMVHPTSWSRADWLEWRRDGIGGSDVASIAGLSGFGSPTAVYYDKVGLAPELPENEPMRWGRVLEAPIAAEFTVETDLHVVCPQALVWDVEHPWRRATLDGLVVESLAEWERTDVPPADVVLGTIQIKTTRDPEWRDGEIPDRIALQCHWEMGVAELRHCWLVVLHGGQKLRIYELEFDPRVFDGLCTIADRFWHDNVVAENAPLADSNSATTDALKAAWNERADGSVVQLDNYAAARALDWLRAKAAVDDAKCVLEGIENDLRSTLGEATFGAVEDVEWVTWKPQRKARRVDEKRLRAERPEIWDDYASPEGVTRVLRPTKALRALADQPDEDA